MKKINKIFVSLFFIFSIVGSAFIPVNVSKNVSRNVSRTGALVAEDCFIDFSTPNPFDNSPFKKANGELKMRDGAASSDDYTATVYLDKEIHSYDVFKVEAEIKSIAKSSWDSTYFAFRTSSRPISADRNDGIIFFINGNKIGIREKWDTSRMVTLSEEFDFSDYRKIYFEDNRDTNVFTIYADNIAREKTLVCTVEFDGNNYIAKNASGVQLITGTIDSNNIVKQGGFQVSTWFATMSLKNIKATMPTTLPDTKGYWLTFPFVSSNNSIEGKYLYAVGGYNSIDKGNVADIWGSDKPTETLFVGDKAGDMVVKYKSGETKTIPLIFGYTMWFYENWIMGKHPIIDTAENEKAFKESMHLYGAFEGNKQCVFKVAMDNKPIASIEIVDNTEKFGEAMFSGGFVTSEDILPPELYANGTFITNIDNDFFATHTVDIDNPYPKTIQKEVEKVAYMMYTFEEDFQAALPYVDATIQKTNSYKIQFSGTPFANIATGILYENSKNLTDRVDEKGELHTSAKDAPSWFYNGVGTYLLNSGSYYNQRWSRDIARGILSLVSINEIDKAEEAMSNMHRLMMYFPEKNLKINDKVIPGHYTMVMNNPFEYPDAGVNMFGYTSKYNKATFGSSYKNIGNLETDAQGLMMMATYSVWKAKGASSDWLNENWTYINEQATWIKWCFDNPDVSFAKDNLLLGECEPAHSEWTLYCNVPCYIGMLMHIEMAQAAGKNDLANEWQVYADRLEQGISQVVNSKGWNMANFGYYHDPVTTFYSDYFGFDISSFMPQQWLANSRNVFPFDIANSTLSKSSFGRSMGYDHSMITQNALLLDETAKAEIFVNNLARACYAPKLYGSYIVPESISVDTTRGLVRRQGDLGNLVQMAEVIKTLLIPVGISPLSGETLTVMPRLIKDWTVDVQDFTVKYSNTKVNLNTSYPHNNSQTTQISLDNIDEVRTIKFRSGPFSKSVKTVIVSVNGKKVLLDTIESGDSRWVWIEVTDVQSKTYDIVVRAKSGISISSALIIFCSIIVSVVVSAKSQIFRGNFHRKK